MKIYKYSNHEEYIDIQTKANIRKLNNVWVDKETISKIYEMVPIAAFILCHGTRNAAEQKYFKHFYPYAEIIGTEISHTASKFEMTIQHDFHEIKEEWINKFLEILAEDEGTEGRKVALEGGKGTRGFGITHISDGLKKFLKSSMV